MEPVAIPKSIDEPIHILLWSADEMVPFMVCMLTGMLIDHFIPALAVGALLWWAAVPLRLSARHRRALPVIGVLIAAQSLCLYSAVARLPVALAPMATLSAANSLSTLM